MKNIINTFIAFVFVAGTLTAQTIVNELKTTTVETFKNDKGDVVTAKIIKHELQPLNLKPAHKNNINQDLGYSPAYVNKLILIDKDEDPYYDKKIELGYTKSLYSKENYITPVDGLSIKIIGDITYNVETEFAEALDDAINEK